MEPKYATGWQVTVYSTTRGNFRVPFWGTREEALDFARDLLRFPWESYRLDPK